MARGGMPCSLARGWHEVGIRDHPHVGLRRCLRPRVFHVRRACQLEIVDDCLQLFQAVHEQTGWCVCIAVLPLSDPLYSFGQSLELAGELPEEASSQTVAFRDRRPQHL